MLVLSVELQGRDEVVIRPDGRLKVNYISSINTHYGFFIYLPICAFALMHNILPISPIC